MFCKCCIKGDSSREFSSDEQESFCKKLHYPEAYINYIRGAVTLLFSVWRVLKKLYHKNSFVNCFYMPCHAIHTNAAPYQANPSHVIQSHSMPRLAMPCLTIQYMRHAPRHAPITPNLTTYTMPYIPSYRQELSPMPWVLKHWQVFCRHWLMKASSGTIPLHWLNGGYLGKKRVQKEPTLWCRSG